MNKILELYAASTRTSDRVFWNDVIARQHCPYLGRKCLKVRKSAPELSIGTCTVCYGQRAPKKIVICPHRLLERHQIFMDCIHLLTLHEPGNELHIVKEVPVPGGSVDHFLVSAHQGRVRDFVGLEIQAVDTTGTVWPERQKFLEEYGIVVDSGDVDFTKTFGMNWKMTAKTILMQLHHKTQTFEHLGKHLVLAVQDHFFDYMQKAFQFEHLDSARLGHPVHFHAYALNTLDNGTFRLSLGSRFSTDSDGVARCLGLQASPKVELDTILTFLENKIGEGTLLTV